jgi:hypothetical protein
MTELTSTFAFAHHQQAAEQQGNLPSAYCEIILNVSRSFFRFSFFSLFPTSARKAVATEAGERHPELSRIDPSAARTLIIPDLLVVSPVTFVG